MEFEYWPSAGTRVEWLLARGRDVVGAVESLIGVETAVEDDVAAWCREQALFVVVVRGGHGWRDFITSGGDTVSYQWSMIVRESHCRSCGYAIDGDTHSAASRAWAPAGDTVARFCVGCREERLHHRLKPDGFADERAPGFSPRSQRPGSGPKPAQSLRPDVTFSAPIGSVDLRAFNDDGDPCEMLACPDCLPWRAEVARDPVSNEIVLREWHAVECPLFQELIHDD